MIVVTEEIIVQIACSRASRTQRATSRLRRRVKESDSRPPIAISAGKCVTCITGLARWRVFGFAIACNSMVFTIKVVECGGVAGKTHHVRTERTASTTALP